MLAEGHGQGIGGVEEGAGFGNGWQLQGLAQQLQTYLYMLCRACKNRGILMIDSEMTPEQFNAFWASQYPDTLPIQHFFKYDYAGRWFRIHSLPQSKRYADTEQEWAVLLARHNTIISDVLGDGAEILLVTGDYNDDEPLAPHITQEEPAFLAFNFQRADEIDLFGLSPEEHAKGQVYRVAYANTIWKPYLHDKLLKGIADERFRAFFISPNKGTIAAPYDGGIDFVLPDTETRDFYKNKYKDWLSEREDGL